jgi:MYXO-CTERM domain-containing protein
MSVSSKTSLLVEVLMIRTSPLFFGLALLSSSAALANTTGQYGYTGLDGSCLQCHGTLQYDGLQVELSGLGSNIDCWVEDEAASSEDELVLKKLSLLNIGFGATADVKVKIPNPTGANVPQCPTSDCCEAAPPADAICNQDGFRVNGFEVTKGTCTPLFNDCTSGANAGFNMEVVNGGAFTLTNAAEGVRFETATGVAVPGVQFACLGGPICTPLAEGQCNAQTQYQGGNPAAPVQCNSEACAQGQLGCACELGDGYGCTGANPAGVGACTRTVACEGKDTFPNGCPANATVTSEDAASGTVTGCACNDGYLLSPQPGPNTTPPYSCVLASGAEVTHSQAKLFNGADVEWNLKYTAPTEDEYTDAVRFYVGANVANGNGVADQADLNSNYQLVLAVGDALPGFCAVCENGELPDDNGQCSGCGCSATNTSEAPYALAGLAALALFVVRRRRA